MTGSAHLKVTLAARTGDVRADLARYLTEAGFEVQVCARPHPPRSPAASLVWVTEATDQPPAIARALAAWTRPAARGRAVIITWHPAALQGVTERLGERVTVLAPPVFAWTVVDALRGQALLR